ncbi:MAG: hypothetical protein WC222_06790 [Parachlamydiales bacterium]|jgi:hypothetical protein
MKKINKPLAGAFDLPSSQFDKSIHFYQSLFGWKFVPMVKEGISGYEISGEEGILGTLIPIKDPEQQATIYIRVESVDKLKELVEPLGGSISPTSMSLPRGGKALLLLDADKNHIVIWEERNTQPTWPIFR